MTFCARAPSRERAARDAAPGDAGVSTQGVPPGFALPRLRIGRDGTWYDGDEEVTHPGIVANLWSNLRIDEQGHHLQVGPARVPVEVEDAPFVVQRAERRGDRLELTLIDGTREPLDPAELRLGAGEVPYCRVKGGRFEARFDRAATYQLLQHVSGDDANRAELVLGTARYRLGRR
jgi:hypothetical protein